MSDFSYFGQNIRLKMCLTPINVRQFTNKDGPFSLSPKLTGIIYMNVCQSVIDRHFKQLIMNPIKLLWRPTCADVLANQSLVINADAT